MKPFRFKNFSINQSENVFRVGTDGVLLGALSTVEEANEILEVGTGTGLISLMLAQRNTAAKILAIDINSEATKIAEENFHHSPFNNRLRAINEDFKQIEIETKFDLIISNPPYFEENSSQKDVFARQMTQLNFQQLISKSSHLISNKGIFSVIIPAEAGEDFLAMAIKNQFFLNRKINIYGIENSKIKRLILEFSFIEKKVEESDFVIEKSPRKYSDHYLEITKDFHLFGK